MSVGIVTRGVTPPRYLDQVTTEQTPQQYFYRSMTPSSRHRNRVSAYFVEHFSDSNVVARIEPLGLVHAVIGEHDLALERLRRDLVVAGSWQSTPGRHHARQRVARRGGPEE